MTLHARYKYFAACPHADWLDTWPLSAICSNDQDLMLGMQEQMFDDFLLELAQKVYMPASRYAPCSNAYQSPGDVNLLASEQCHGSQTHG